MKDFTKIVNKLRDQKLTISTMESCTGGKVASEITNIPGASEVLKFSAVTYSNEYKIKMGVDEKVIAKYSVYSMETAMEMAKKISMFSNSNWGIGITGKLKRKDEANLFGDDSTVYVCLYNKDKDMFYKDTLLCKYDERAKNKDLIIDKIITMLEEIL